ncbi:MAG: hypothetical protein HY746_05890 [Elusimicrobia bacterium]|nr:hypothetical protein [Elusimicrobiota bacterium]
METGKILVAETGKGQSSASVSGGVYSPLKKNDLRLWIGLRKAVEDVKHKITK